MILQEINRFGFDTLKITMVEHNIHSSFQSISLWTFISIDCIKCYHPFFCIHLLDVSQSLVSHLEILEYNWILQQFKRLLFVRNKHRIVMA